MAVFKTLQFLPEIFRTEANKKFLNATVDQLISEPNLIKINGYIGRKLAPSYKTKDSYISEPTTGRQNYQLEPTIIIKDPITSELTFASTYEDIVNKINFYGGLTNNHNRLFDNEYYSYNPQIELDKFINFVQYYWLENGPDTVTISASDVPLERTFTLAFNATTNTYNIEGFENIPNPSITLVRGGTYTFVVNEPDNKFYIQTKPGTQGVDPNATNLNTRSVMGVSNNGEDSGSVVFRVPTSTAQIQWTNLPIVDNVNYATSLSFQSLQGCLVSDLENVLGGLDGPSTSYENLSVVFINNSYIDDQYWHDTARVNGGIIYLDQDNLISVNDRTAIYQLNVYSDTQGNQRIYLSKKFSVNNENKVRITAGVSNAGKEFYKRIEIFNEVPTITAPLNVLYYQSDQSDTAVGEIKIADFNAFALDPATEIVGQVNYVSPSGVKFSNGLKITFDSTAAAPYTNNTYYVEGVGTSIRLVAEDILVCSELDNDLSSPDYLTINRGSIDRNAWSRSNRWFHVDIIEKTAQYNNTELVLDQSVRAQRPIIEFNPDLQLFNFGTEGKNPVDILDDIITNAYSQIQGTMIPYIPPAIPTDFTITVDGKSLTLTNGDRVIFSNDENLEVRNKIFTFSVEAFTETVPVIYRAYIEEAVDSNIQQGHTVSVNSGANGQKQWHYNGTSWIESQQKTSINQAPTFDIVTNQGASLGNESVFPQTNFQGTKLFSYKVGTGTNDNVLGFPVSYRNLNTQGDIVFENNFDLDTFTYRVSSGLEEISQINIGLLQKNISRTVSTRTNIWQINENFSKQYQNFSFVYDGTTNLFPIDILPDRTVDSPNIRVVINNVRVPNGNFAITQTANKLAILVNPDLLEANDVVFINIFSSQNVSKTGFYEVPINLDVNPLNNSVTTLTLGQMRNHLIAYKNNSTDIEGAVPGKSNLRDINYVSRGGNILQHSSPVVYPGLFLNHPTMNFVESLRLASKEYSQFKIKFLEFAANLNLDRDNVAESVDTILLTINNVKNNTFPWQYSDMVPYGDNDKVVLPTYRIFDPTIRSYEITNIFRDTVTSNKAVLVYITRTLNNVTSTELLIKGKDYYFEQNRPAITLTDEFILLLDDSITIVEYNNTDNCYIPETPTKLGIYPKYAPEIFTDTTYRTPIPVIQGHDGSLTPAFGDFRDNFLLELERRIYNNIKIEYNVNNFNINDYIPGKFRILDYTRQEFNQILGQNFLRWAGTNRVDFTTNDAFTASDSFTWNYKKFRDVINGESLPGTWRSIFRYFFDTDRPHTHPWEMLGFSEKPDYWNERYGPAPYTGGNFVLWSDLESGYIHSGSRAGIDLRYSRPGLTDFIPVDDSGNLRSPTEFLVTDFDSAGANTSYAVGDIGPAELAWRRSSEFPFAVHFALALAKPARYFSLLVDVEEYTRNFSTGQFLITDDGHITPSLIRVNGFEDSSGNIQRSSGYINWIRDYVKNLGIADASETIKNNLSLITVQLSHRLAGFSDKRLLELLAEQFSPSSISDSVVIPDENYSIELYKGAPVDKLSYSAVIIEKTGNGYTVSGYDLNNPYFSLIPSLPNNNSYTIETSGARATIYKDYKNQRLSIPYGFEFDKKQQVVDFLVGYQRYLISQGFIFEDRDNQLNEQKDWILSAKEFLHWSTQGWRQGNLIVLSPVSDTIKIFNELAVADEITSSVNGSRVIDINFTPVRKNNFTISRESGLFTFKALANQTIGLAVFNLVQYEHLLVLDNTTVFNDVIYVPETGNRQFRLKLIGAKTGFWNGSLELPGYVFSDRLVEEWSSGVDYLKGTLVRYKSNLYTALQNIVAADQFQILFWKQISETELKTGMINNLATNASQSIQYYDINNQPLDEKLQLFSNGLIGFRPREYFTNLGIDVVTQSKFYQGLIKQGGTLNAINALRGAQFNNLDTQPLSLYENWAIRVGEYGALELNEFVEFILSEQSFKNNPAVFKFQEIANDTETDITVFDESQIYKTSNRPLPVNFLRTESLDNPAEFKPLPVAGFVNLDDVDGTILNINDYANYAYLAAEIGTGYKIWTAKDFDNKWNVYRATPVPGAVFIIKYNLDSSAQFICNAEHGLAVNDLVVLKNFDSRFNGLYQVKSIIDSTRFLVTVYSNLQDLINNNEILGQGILLKLVSNKLPTPISLVDNAPYAGWIANDKVWVEQIDSEYNWGVYTKTDPWDYRSNLTLEQNQYTGNDNYGKSVVLDSSSTFLYAGAPNSGAGRVGIYARDINDNFNNVGSLFGKNDLLVGYGKTLATGTTAESVSYVVIGAPETANGRGVVYVYADKNLIGIISDQFGSNNDLFGASLAMSDDAKYLYIGAPGAGKVFCYALDYPRDSYTKSITASLASSVFTIDVVIPNLDASKLLVNSPLRAAQFFPNIDYTISEITNGIRDFTPSGTASAGDLSYIGLAATGGTGTGAIFNVKKSNGSYTGADTEVQLYYSGSGYTVNDVLTIPGTSLGGITPSNDLTITITAVGTVTNVTFTNPPAANEYLNFSFRPQHYSLLYGKTTSTYVVGASGSNTVSVSDTANVYVNQLLAYTSTPPAVADNTYVTSVGSLTTLAKTATGTAGTNTITVNTNVGLLVNQFVTSSNGSILPGTYVVSIVGTVVTLSTNLQLNMSTTAVTFSGATVTLSKNLLDNLLGVSVSFINLSLLPTRELSLGSKFGSSVVCNSDGSSIAIGASNTIVNSKLSVGVAYIYHRTMSELLTTGVSNTFSFPDNLNTVYKVFYNNDLIYSPENAPGGVDALYSVQGSNIIQYGDPGVPSLPPRNKIFIESNQFVLDQIIYPQTIGTVQVGSFGSEMEMCSSGCNLYVSSPDFAEGNYSLGIVTRYVNIGRVYGTIVGTVENPTVTVGESILINNRLVTFTGSTLASVISNINTANIPGVTATSEENKLKIISDVVVAANKLNIVSGNTGTPLDDLGILNYQYVQIIRHPESAGEVFGTKLKVDQSTDTLAIASAGADIFVPMAFDTTSPVETTFDGRTTTFAEILNDSGAVYLYNLLPNPYEDIDNPSLFAYSQKVVGPNLEDGFDFGSSIALRSKYLIIGVANDFNLVLNGGSLYYFYNENVKSGWELTRYKEPRVDTGAVIGSFLYNIGSQQILDFFDYLDPAKGKLLGVVDQELDHKEEYDPASYNQSSRIDTINNTNFYWSNKQVGRTWWDLSTASFIDYEQSDLTYRAKNWGRLFPDSQVTIYEWIESDFLPSQYADASNDGIPKYADDSAYSSVTVVDPVTGIINQKYYFWVSGKLNVDSVVARRTLSTTALEKYISNPKDQNIPYLGLLAPNAVAVYNVNDKLTGNNVAIHLNIAESRNTNLIHTEWQLVKQGAGAESIPDRAIKKLEDSLIGFDVGGNSIPDPLLNAQDKLGILVKPRQSMFNNRLLALRNYVETLNNVLIQYPILLISTPGLLNLEDPIPASGFDSQTGSVNDLNYIDTSSFPDGYKILVPSDSGQEGKWTIYSYNAVTDEFDLFRIQKFKTRLFWTPVEWYDSEFNDGKTINYILNIYSDTQAISPEIGDYVKILDNGQGKWLLYEVQNDYSLSLIGAQDGTFQVNSDIYDVSTGSGYDTSVYDSSSYDPVPVVEIRNIYESVYKEILVGNLSTEFNNLFLTLLNFIFTEQKNPDWVIKTSFVDVFHTLRGLDQFPNFVRDNQNFYIDYINEVKPYRTQVREYIPNYYKIDTTDGSWTDFDLPSAYDSRYQEFRSPNIALASDETLFASDLYSDWADNYKFKITDYIIGNVGLNYSLAPNVEITGGGGSGAAAITTIDANGKVSGVTVINPGSGYTSTPNVFINGDGTGATLYPLLKNEFYASQANLSYNLVRSIDSVIKFDRYAYTSNLVVWEPNSSYANTVVTSGNVVNDPGNIYVSSGNIVVYNNQAFLATNAYAAPWAANTVYVPGSLVSLSGNVYVTTGNIFANSSSYVNVGNVQITSVFDFTRFSRIDSGNVLLNALDRITAYYSPESGMTGKNINELVYGTSYPAAEITGPEFRANAFEVSSNIISFNYDGLTINSGNVAAFNFIDSGFELNQTIRIEANVPFDFQNNGYFRIISVDRDTMTLTGQPVETTYKLYLDKNITANVGDYITQDNTLANAWVLQSATNTNQLDIIYSSPSFLPVPAGNIYANLFLSLNGSNIAANVTSVTSFNKGFTPYSSGGNVDVTIAYLDQQFIIDSNIYSTYLDTELGTRPQDINIVGGAYVDIYSSHAPEELIPGRIYDSLEMRVFSNTAANTATYGFRVFQPMSSNIVYTRISEASTTSLASNLALLDTEILVVDASKLPEPNPVPGVPGVVFVNGECIHYYQKFDAAKLSTAIPWTANTAIPLNTLIVLNSNVYLTTGNVYAMSNVSVNAANIQLVKLNSLTQIRRGVDGTGVPNVHLANSQVVDSSLAQFIPDAQIYSAANITGNVTTTSNVTYKVTLSAPITANIGDYLTQFANTGNARILSNITNANVVAVDFVTGTFQLASNIATRVNLVSLTNGLSSSNANVVTAGTLGTIYANGNVVLSSTLVLRSNIWEQLGTTLENSTTVPAQFIRAEPSYIP